LLRRIVVEVNLGNSDPQLKNRDSDPIQLGREPLRVQTGQVTDDLTTVAHIRINRKISEKSRVNDAAITRSRRINSHSHSFGNLKSSRLCAAAEIWVWLPMAMLVPASY